MLPAYFDPIRARISELLRRFFQEKREELARVNPLGRDASERLVEFTLGGKMIRGCLVHLGWSIGSRGRARPAPEESASVAAAGAAMELFQSGLLVHDDIMDRDLVRRGRPSIFQQYAQKAGREGHADPAHVGQALGICAGDVACFMAFELLARVRAPAPVQSEVLALCARELSAVGIAQMQDVAWGASKDGVKVDDILRMYRYKTGRYSFSLPLRTGALIAGADRDLQEKTGSLRRKRRTALPDPRRRAGAFRRREGAGQARGIRHPRGKEDDPHVVPPGGRAAAGPPAAGQHAGRSARFLRRPGLRPRAGGLRQRAGADGRYHRRPGRTGPRRDTRPHVRSARRPIGPAGTAGLHHDPQSMIVS